MCSQDLVQTLFAIDLIYLILFFFLYTNALLHFVKIVKTKIITSLQLYDNPYIHHCSVSFFCYTISAKGNLWVNRIHNSEDSSLYWCNKHRSVEAGVLNSHRNLHLYKAGTKAFPAGWNFSIIVSTKSLSWLPLIIKFTNLQKYQ